MQMKMVKVIVFIAGIFMLSASIFGFWHIFYTYKNIYIQYAQLKSFIEKKYINIEK